VTDHAAHLAPVIDLMEALKKSLADKQAPVAVAPKRTAGSRGGACHGRAEKRKKAAS